MEPNQKVGVQKENRSIARSDRPFSHTDFELFQAIVQRCCLFFPSPLLLIFPISGVLGRGVSAGGDDRIGDQVLRRLQNHQDAALEERPFWP